MFQFFCTKSLNLCENSTLVSHSTRLKLAQPMNLHTRSASRNTGHEKSAAIKAQTCWVATEQTIRKASGDFHLQSFRSDRGEGKGERGSVPWGAGNKPDTSKSLHMGNLSGRGTSLLLGRISCESGRLITIVGLVQF